MTARTASGTKRRAVDTAYRIIGCLVSEKFDAEMLAMIAASLDNAAELVEHRTMPQLDAHLAEQLIATVTDVRDPAAQPRDDDTAPDSTFWQLQQRICREVLVEGGLSDAELAEALAERQLRHGEWSNVDELLPTAARPQIDAVAPQDASATASPPEAPQDRQRRAERQDDADDDAVLDAEVVEVVDTRPQLVSTSPSGQKRYRVPGGYNPRDRGIGGLGRSLSPGRPQVTINTSSPHLGDQR